MTKRLSLVSLASASTMGQQVYEAEIARRAPVVLDASWDVRRVVVRSLRSPLDGTWRLPARLLVDGSAMARRAAGLVAYGSSGLVHRMDLRLPPAAGTEALTVHDAVSWRFPDEGAPPPSAFAEARRSAVVICPSQFSADEAQKVLGIADPIVIHNGVDDSLLAAEPLPEAELVGLGVRGPFVLHAGGCTLRKNLRGLASAWSKVSTARPDVSLVLVGPPDPRRDRLFASSRNAILAGRLPSTILSGLMASAAAVVVPSLYEGFGLPAIEGMAAGAPVVASNRSSLPEICGEDAILVEPTGSGLAEGLLLALDGGSEIDALRQRGRVRAAGFSWQASAEAHAKVWRHLGP